MMKCQIRLRPDEVAHFVETARRCDFDINIAYNRYIVDGKSLLGVMGLDFSRVLTVTYYGYNEAFDSLLRSNAVAC